MAFFVRKKELKFLGCGGWVYAVAIFGFVFTMSIAYYSMLPSFCRRTSSISKKPERPASIIHASEVAPDSLFDGKATSNTTEKPVLPISTVPRLAVSKIPVTRSSDKKLPPAKIIPNRDYGFLTIENACYMAAAKSFLLIGNKKKIRQEIETSRNSTHRSAIVWKQMSEKGISGGEFQYQLMSQPPDHFKYVPGNTTAVPISTNANHNYGDRLWPLIFTQVPPLRKTGIHDPQHYLILSPTGTSPSSLFMWQAMGVVAMDPKADVIDFDVVDEAGTKKGKGAAKRGGKVDTGGGGEGEGEAPALCFERLRIPCISCHRNVYMDKTSPSSVLATKEYRRALARISGQKLGSRRTPPKKLHVALYTRMGDAKRRRIVNGQHIVEMLKSHPCNCMSVVDVDLTMRMRSTPGSLDPLSHVKLLAGTDLLIASHGAFLSLAMMLPLKAGMIEIGGPCKWSSWSNLALYGIQATHDISNPVDMAVANPTGGNTIKCVDVNNTPDFTVDLQKLGDAVDRMLRSWGYLDAPQ